MFEMAQVLICLLGVGCQTLKPQQSRIQEFRFETREECVVKGEELVRLMVNMSGLPARYKINCIQHEET